MALQMLIAVWVVQSITLATLAVNSFSRKYIPLDNANVSPYSMTLVGPSLQCSIGQCAGACNTLRNECHGFAFQPTTSSEPAVAGTESCQPVKFSGTGNVALSGGQRLRVNTDLCSDESNPCMNNGACDLAGWPNICKCRPSYNGTYCERGE